MKKRFALISVYEKTGIMQLAQALQKKGVEIISTGGTAKFLKERGLQIIPIEKVTGSSESFDGRIKTISLQVLSGILFERSNKKHVREAKELSIKQIDYVICNFYPFLNNQTIEMIDVGGPTMVRAAAKNYEDVTVVVDPDDYPKVAKEITDLARTSIETRRGLGAKAFSYVAAYDLNIANFFQKENGTMLRYGENPHQKGSFLKDITDKDKLGLGNFKLLQGKSPSFNNLLDMHAALEVITLIGQEEPACVIVKHTNPCGVAIDKSIEKAFHKAWFDGDSLAAFGGIVIVNRMVTGNLAKSMVSDKKFFEILAAPQFAKEALIIFAKKPGLQLWKNKALTKPFIRRYQDIKRIRGGFLMQDMDVYQLTLKDLRVVTKKKPTKRQIDDLLFAWKIAQASKSNCVVVAKNKTLLSSGVGQQDRKRCCELCVNKAAKSLKNTVAATDGFFPFRDGPDVLIKAGVKAIIQPGGSIRDQEVIDACNEKEVAMVFTNVRAFRH